MLAKKEINKLKRKAAKSAHILCQHEGIQVTEQPSKILYVSNAGLGNGVSREHIYTWLEEFCEDIEKIVMVPRKPYSFICLLNLTTAGKIQSLNGQQVTHAGISIPVQHIISYIEQLPAFAEKAEEIPKGLMLLSEYITIEEEDKFLHCLQWQDVSAWSCHTGLPTHEMKSAVLQTAESFIAIGSAESQMKHRSVQHFGYEFKYTTNNVDENFPLEEKIPIECDSLINRLIAEGILPCPPDQLTVNKYEPGQGIPPHVDTHSAFLEPIISLSLGSQTVMKFSHPSSDETYHALLPPRSLLVMNGESRYVWSHGITPRKSDVISTSEGLTLTHRQTRVSYTFRILRREACQCGFPDQCDSQQSNGSKMAGLNEEEATKLEKIHVHEVYNTIADHFSGTRHTQWPLVSGFLSAQPAGTIMADIGCGNGKYLTSSPDMFKLGIERSEGLVSVCHQRGFNACLGDVLHIPIISNCVDVCLCIAVIHHLSTEMRRLAALQELIRILRPGGQCLIYVWAMEQRKDSVKSNYLRQNDASEEEYLDQLCTMDGDFKLPIHKNRTEFKASDMLVPWNLKQPARTSQRSDNASNDSTENQQGGGESVYHRYYHIFKEGELEKLCSHVAGVTISKSYYDKGNWCVILVKNDKI